MFDFEHADKLKPFVTRNGCTAHIWEYDTEHANFIGTIEGVGLSFWYPNGADGRKEEGYDIVGYKESETSHAARG